MVKDLFDEIFRFSPSLEISDRMFSLMIWILFENILNHQSFRRVNSERNLDQSEKMRKPHSSKYYWS